MSPATPERSAFGESFQEVLAAAQAGGEWAWRELYLSLSPVVLGYLRGRGAGDPDGLLGEVFLHVVRAIHSFSGGEGAFRAWVLTIARRRVIDEHRRREGRPEVVVTTDHLEAIGPTGDVEREALSSLEAARVIEAIRELTPDQQDVLLLRMVGDLSVAEVARILGKRQNAVKALQHRAMAALTRRFSAEAVSP